MQNLSGTIWKLVEVRACGEDGREVDSPIPCPLGITMFGDERILAAVTDTRPAQPSGAPARVFFSYTGTYRWDGSTLSTIADADVIYVIEDGRAQFRTVDVIRRSGGLAAIGKGLKQGERIILYPGDQIGAGVRVGFKP